MSSTMRFRSMRWCFVCAADRTVKVIARSGERCLQIGARLIKRLPSILKLFLLIGKLRLQLLHLFAGCGGAAATRRAGCGPRSRLRRVGGRLVLWHWLLLGSH